MTKTVRSPNYPMISLGEAVERIRAVWEKENRHPADKVDVAKALGYGSLNGASMGIISALIKYGFLEPVAGGQLKVSPLGMDVSIYGHQEPERVGAVRAAAFRPALFSELFDRYGPTLPSDNNLRSYLVKRGFNPRTVDGVIRSYRDTVQFLDEESDGMWLEDGDGNLLPVQPSQTAQTPLVVNSSATTRGADGDFLDGVFRRSASVSHQQPPKPEEGTVKVLVFNIAEDAEARVEFRGRVTQEAIDKLIKMLELQQDTFPSRDTLPSPSASAPPIPDGSQNGGDTEDRPAV